MELIQSSGVGVTIESSHFNCIYYADDLLLCRATVTGLQHLMDVSNSYIKDHGLTFNPEKSTCFMIETNPFSSVPQWSLDGINVSLKESITFLGSVSVQQWSLDGINVSLKESITFLGSVSVPQWSLDGINVSLKESITFLGSVLGDGKGSGNCDSRVRNATRSLYALQGAGIIYPGVSPVISLCSIRIWYYLTIY